MLSIDSTVEARYSQVLGCVVLNLIYLKIGTRKAQCVCQD